MADSESGPHRQLSLVPYASDSREVVLRHGSSVVMYDRQSKELSLRKASQAFAGLTECPLCHRPLHDASPQYEDAQETAPPTEEQTFVDPNYFRMLAHSIPPSPNSSRPASPFKQLPASQLEQTLPPDAEFHGSAPAPQASDKGISGSSFVPNYFKSFFVEKRELGRGGRGIVLLVEHVLDSVSLGEFACKRIPVGNDHGWLEKVLVEVQLLQQLNHPNLVSYRHVWLEDAQVSNFGPSVPCIFILQQYCNAGDLHDYVLKSVKTHVDPKELKERMRRKSRGQPEIVSPLHSPRRMQFDEIFSFFRDITSGLHHLHMNGYIHRDLKPSNCLLNKTGQRLTVHVSDFGEVQATSAKRSSTGATGTISYCAPEVLRRETPDGAFGNFSTKSDIFSLGMIVYFMCFGHLPYVHADELNDENEDIDQLRAEVSRWGGFDESIRARTDLPERLYSFLKRLLSPDPAKRPSTEQILQAIKAGGDIDTPAFQTPEPSESTPRITSVDTPTRKPSNPNMRRSSTGLARPGLSLLGRNQSAGEVVHSGRLKSRDSLRNNSLNESGVVVRATRNLETPPPTSPPSTQPKTEQQPQPSEPARLIMPPPQSLHDRLMFFSQPPYPLLLFKGILFSFKMLTLSWPCAPYAASLKISYPLMCLSVLDFIFQTGMAESLTLLGLHLLVWSTAVHWNQMCNSTLVVWDAA